MSHKSDPALLSWDELDRMRNAHGGLFTESYLAGCPSEYYALQYGVLDAEYRRRLAVMYADSKVRAAEAALLGIPESFESLGSL